MFQFWDTRNYEICFRHIGCNVSCLKILGLHNSGSFFTALHFFFALGNVFGPILAEVFLQDDLVIRKNLTQVPSGNDTTLTTESVVVLNDLQQLHIFIGVLLLICGLGFVCLVRCTGCEPETENGARNNNRKRRSNVDLEKEDEEMITLKVKLENVEEEE